MKLLLAFAYGNDLFMYILEEAVPPPLCHLHILIDAATATAFAFFSEQGRVIACGNKTLEKNYNANMSMQIIVLLKRSPMICNIMRHKWLKIRI